MEKIKDGIKWIGDSMTGAVKTFLIGATIIILAFMVASLFFSCNDNKIDPGVKPVDKPTDKPTEKDTTKAIYQIQKIFSEAPPIVMPTTPPIEMKDGDNYAHLQGLIDNVADGAYATFVIPSGTFYLSKTLRIFNKAIWLIGSNNTKFNIEPGQSGLIISGDRSINGIPTVANIVFSSGQKDSVDGVICHGITNLFNVTSRGFSGNAFSFTADIAASKTNVSHSKIYFCYAIENGSNGFYFQGGDANAINVVDCDARDNGGIGFYDHGFLGNRFWNCMAHYNKKGDYVSDDPNARTVFAGCYSEGQGVKNVIGGAGRVYGGIYADGWQLLTPWAKVDAQ